MAESQEKIHSSFLPCYNACRKTRRLHWQDMLERIRAKRERRKYPARKNRRKRGNGVLAKELVLKKTLRL
jgi:hypothetical protein